MSFIFLIIGTVLATLFIILMKKGEKYDDLLEGLTSDVFPLKSIYTVGLAIQDFKFGRIPDKIGASLRKNTTLQYSRKYSEYYSRIIWAQSISFAGLILAVSMILAGIIPSMSLFFAGFGAFLAFAAFGYFLTSTKNFVKTRQDECEAEFPNAISKLALIVNSGVIIREAWEKVANGNTGVFYELMQQSCELMHNGKSDSEAIYDFGVYTNSNDIKKFTSALIQSLERGGGELPGFLANQSSQLWNERKQKMLQKGENASGALLAPIAIMLLGVMLIIIVSALQSFSL